MNPLEGAQRPADEYPAAPVVPTALTMPTALTVRWGHETWTIPATSVATIGRGADSTVRITHPQVSRRHATVFHGPDSWRLRDEGSRLGTYCNGARIVELSLTDHPTVRLGDAESGPTLDFPAPEHLVTPAPGSAALPSLAGHQPTATHRTRSRTVRIGRGQENDVILADLLVSRQHAELVVDGPRTEVIDLGSHNGTFVNGQRTQRARLGPDDILSIGHSQFVLRGDDLVQYVDSGEISFQASGLTVTAGQKVLVDNVSFALEEKMLLAVVGPSGAGKSTLLGALTGFRPARRGRVLYDGRDLYEDYDDLRQRIGLVPQDDILHPQLTVRTALRYAAELRFPTDVTAAERHARVEEVIDELGLTGQATNRIGTQLSGGQRKRVSVALELLTLPSLLFLDEPTSGLDPGTEKSVMVTLRALADDGRTIVVVTHNVAQLGLCDRILMLAPGGVVAYFGPPSRMLDYFGAEGYPEVFTAVADPTTDWGARYRSSSAYEEHVAAKLIDHPAGGEKAAAVASPPRGRTGAHLRTLCRRYLAVVAADRQYVALLVALPVVLSLLSRVVPAPTGLAPAAAGRPPNLQAVTVLFILVASGCLMGSTVALRELVKERAIYRRERAIGLSPTAYVGSKLLVLSGVASAQSVVLVVLSLVGRRVPGRGVLGWSAWPELAVATAVVTIACMAVGLAISAASSSVDQTMPLLTAFLMTQLLLTGALFPLDGRPGLDQLSWLAPSRWGYAAVAVTVHLRRVALMPDDQDPLWAYRPAHWFIALAMLVLLCVLAVLAVGVLLRRQQPGRR